MNLSNFFRRAKSSLKFWASAEPAAPEPPEFQIDEVAERVAKLTVPQPREPMQVHALVKLAPIPVPREVRWEGQAIYIGAWAGTAVMAWGSFYVPVDWLLWYGAACVVLFALLFRMEGPRTRAERMSREQEVQRCHEAYVQAEAHFKAVLTERFQERVEEFNTLRAAYEQARKALADIEASNPRRLLAALSNPSAPEQELAEQVGQLERRMVALADELEDFSDIHKETIDAALMARQNARLAYWQAKLDLGVMTGEAVQQH